MHSDAEFDRPEVEYVAPLGGNLIEIFGFSTATLHETRERPRRRGGQIDAGGLRGSIFVQI
jgi:hypothetical protein